MSHLQFEINKRLSKKVNTPYQFRANINEDICLMNLNIRHVRTIEAREYPLSNKEP